jgi:hypothetical protein
MIVEYKKLGDSKNCLLTIAIGEPYKTEWENYALPNWIKYCEEHDLGILAVTSDLIDRSDPSWKKPTWQKLLLARKIKNFFPEVKLACYLDTDFLLNPFAPNIFEAYDGKSYGLVSQVKNMPMSLELVQRQYVFLRHKYYDDNYPLDSVVFMPLEEQYKFSGLSPVTDSACAGLILLNPALVADEMENWFFKYDTDTLSITGGDQTHLNWEMIQTGRVQWLPYEFQALWVYEMAWKYSFLYTKYQNDFDIIRECIEASLFSNYFLHFAGSWHESDMWTLDNIMLGQESLKLNASFRDYLKLPVSGTSKGLIKPKV